MNVTLYSPNHPPTTENTAGFGISEVGTFSQVPPQAAALLGVKLGLVDVLAAGPGYVVYTVFDCEEAANHVATQVVSELTGIEFDATDEDTLLRGPVVVVKA